MILAESEDIQRLRRNKTHNNRPAWALTTPRRKDSCNRIGTHWLASVLLTDFRTPDKSKLNKAQDLPFRCQSTLIPFQYIQYSQASPLSLLFFRLGSFPTPLGEKDKNQSQYRGILLGAGGKEYAKSIVGQNTMLAGIS
jgi:hypothetical protein